MRQFRRIFILSLCAAFAGSGTLADEVLLKGGGRVSGVVVDRTATAVVIETGPGRVTLPLTRVEKIVAAGARSSSSKIPGPIGRRLQEPMLKLVFRHLVTEKSTEWMSGHRIDWEAPVG